jgi:ankyrin repeat protein
VILRRAFLALALAAAAAPAGAQFSNSYTFLKAVRDRDGGKVQEMLDRNAATLINTRDFSSGERAIHIVTRERDRNWLAFMLGKGADPNAKDGQGQTALHIAASIGFLDGAQLLMLRKAQIDPTNNAGETPLILAVQRRDMAMVRFLLTEGADPNKKDTVAGQSARDYATRDGRSQAIVKLMDEIKPTPKKGVAGPK